MRIAVDIREVKPGVVTGIGRLVRTFLDLVEPDGDSIVLFADRNTDIERYGKRFETHVLRSPCTIWFDQISLARALKRERIDVFFSPFYKLPLLVDCQKVMLVCDLHYLTPLLRNNIRERLKPYKRQLQITMGRAQRIITISNFSKSEILRQFDVESSKVEVVYPGIDSRFSPASLPEEGKYILYCGNLMPHKNLQTLIRAYGKLRPELSDRYPLVIVGRRDSHYDELASLAEEFGVSNRIVWKDFATDEELVDLYRQAAVFVFPSLHEGFGYPPLEAMACGAPVICSNASSLPEVLSDAVELFDPTCSDALAFCMRNVLTDELVRRRLRNSGLRQAAKYSVKLFAGTLYRTIRDVNENSSPR